MINNAVAANLIFNINILNVIMLCRFNFFYN